MLMLRNAKVYADKQARNRRKREVFGHRYTHKLTSLYARERHLWTSLYIYSDIVIST